MSQRKRWVSLVYAFVFLLLGVSETLACECLDRNDFELEFALSKAVFSGEVVSLEDTREESMVTFRVDKMWKGQESETLVVRTNSRGKSCGFNFRKGDRYLVYAYDEKMLRTSICTRTAPINYALDDLRKLSGSGWSESVNGFRARLAVLPSERPGSPICRVFIEMQNVGKGMGPRKIRFHTDRLELRVTDAASGKPLERVIPPYSGFAPDHWDPLPLPYAGSIRFQISYPGMGVSPDARSAIDMGHSNAWVIPTEGHYLLSARLAIPAEKGDHEFLDWSGALDLPPVRIPVCRSTAR